MKKIKVLSVFAIMILLFSLCACGENNQTMSSENPAETAAQNVDTADGPADENASGEAPDTVSEPGVSESVGTPEEAAESGEQSAQIPVVTGGVPYEATHAVINQYGLNDSELVKAPDGTSYQESAAEKYSCSIYLDENQKIYDLKVFGDSSDESKAFFAAIASDYYSDAAKWIQENWGNDASVTANGYVLSLADVQDSTALRITEESYNNAINVTKV